MRHRPVLSFAILTALTFGAAGTAWSDSTREFAPKPEAAPAPAAKAATYDDAEHRVAAGNYRDAIPILPAIVKAEPNNTDALNLMGFSLRKTGQTDLALQYYNRALSLQPKHLGANEYLGELYVELGQVDKAKERLAILRGACGNCRQAADLADFIAKGPGGKSGS